MLRLCASDCSTELPVNYEPELACTELLPTECSDVSVTMVWIEKTTNMLHLVGLWDEHDTQGCQELGDESGYSDDLNLDYCQNACLDDWNNCNALNYLPLTNTLVKCTFFECDPAAEPARWSFVPDGKAYIYTRPREN